MMEAPTGILKDDELDLIREVEAERMELLDEDELLALHKRVRRARKKHTKNYRRLAAAGVVEEGARGTARPRHGKAAQRAEIFEEALSRVSNRLAAVAQETYEALKAERLERAAAGKSSGPHGSTGPAAGGVGPGRAAEHQTSPGTKKKQASSQAAGAKRQAKRDSK
ncbi:hypothetical protein [Paeniglutamicibacter kerguelensis]|uniref:Uncharacterized protein n=1 Tax=Paeniglutamicibacter kerguelensis TaxID=254788 RepID=A0ABS4XG71_9MICC|nr:hypothetical protein [Paeniglutamicibacter kerguelensis]MBP2387248.1 hypothetical protein [Paeniglutamicibacter kerguelensis]